MNETLAEIFTNDELLRDVRAVLLQKAVTLPLTDDEAWASVSDVPDTNTIWETNVIRSQDTGVVMRFGSCYFEAPQDDKDHQAFAVVLYRMVGDQRQLLAKNIFNSPLILNQKSVGLKCPLAVWIPPYAA